MLRFSFLLFLIVPITFDMNMFTLIRSSLNSQGRKAGSKKESGKHCYFIVFCLR